MNNFSDNLKTEQLSRWKHKLLSELVYIDSEIGEVFVEKGFETDFASIRPLRILFPIIYATLAGYGNASAVIHDKLYASQTYARKTCDKVFYRALRDEGISLWRTNIFYFGIRITGWKAFRLK